MNMETKNALDRIKNENPTFVKDVIIAALCANEETDADLITLMLSPERDMQKMGKVYTETLGYNPITHFDYNNIHDAYEKLLGNIDSSNNAKSNISEHADEVENAAKEIFDENRSEAATISVVKAVQCVFGDDSDESSAMIQSLKQYPLLDNGYISNYIASRLVSDDSESETIDDDDIIEDELEDEID